MREPADFRRCCQPDRDERSYTAAQVTRPGMTARPHPLPPHVLLFLVQATVTILLNYVQSRFFVYKMRFAPADAHRCRVRSVRPAWPAAGGAAGGAAARPADPDP